MMISLPVTNSPRVVIIGCGFGGLEFAKTLRGANTQLVLLDKNNYHTFQPLLYQVATSGLEADSIAYPIRKIFHSQKNFHFRWGELQQIVPAENKIITSIGELRYDHLVLAIGSTTNFFDNTGFEKWSMPMKAVTEALNLRSLILQNLERALLTSDATEQAALMTITIVGGGPTGVELAGALCELKKHVLPNDYPELDFKKMRVVLLENGKELLQTMLEPNRLRAKKYLEEMGCEIYIGNSITAYDGNIATAKSGLQIPTRNLIWTAGVKGVPVQGLKPEVINSRGRMLTDEFCRVKGYENIYAIGDIGCIISEKYPNGHPQLAPVAQQQGRLVAHNLIGQWKGKQPVKFDYFDKGTMATVGRNKAVVEIHKFNYGGMLGWFSWMFLHLMLLVGFRNRVIVFINWVWNYINYDRNIRLIIRPFKRN